MSANIREFHQGATYERTRRKFGKKTADKQAVAAAYSQRRKSLKDARSSDREKRTKARKARK